MAMRFDGCHPSIVNECSGALPITLIITVAKGKYRICGSVQMSRPFFRKGSSLSSKKRGDYRQVSLTSIIDKVCETFNHEFIMNFRTSNMLITKAQHRFIRKKGCIKKLLEARDILNGEVHLVYRADVIYTDFGIKGVLYE